MRRMSHGLLGVLAVFVVGFLSALAVILKLNCGHFTYTLDDPYIHLALAERISAGHYGINPSEWAAPSSSIAWPFLLVPLIHTRLGEFVPLLVGFAAGMGTAAIYYRLVRLALGRTQAETTLLSTLITILLVLATNLVGLPFTGMEHSLQVFLTALVVLGLVREAETGHVRSCLLIGIAAGPLIRYENLGISAAAIAYLAVRGHGKQALLTATAVLVPVCAFSAFLLCIGLDPLPSSVLLKAPTFSEGLLAGFRTTLRDPSGVLLGLAGLWMLCISTLMNRLNAERALAGCMAVAIGLHALSGRYGAYHRWEIYIVAATLLTLIYLERRSIASAAIRRPFPFVAGMAVLWCVVIGGRYMFGLLTVPLAANNIHEQQYQLHRFVLEHERRPVAVNDLGYVSYRNPQYVLDLLGLGSAGFTKQTGDTVRADSLRIAAALRGIDTAILYEQWFPNLPTTWIKVGELHLSRPRISPAWETVTFYATSRTAYPRVRERLLTFSATLPKRVRFSIVRG